MAFIPAIDTAQAKIIQSLHGQTVINQLYFEKAGGWDSADLTALANLIISWWNDHLADELSDDMTLVSVQCRNMEVEEGEGVEVGAPAGSGGNNTAQGAMPGNVALAVKFITGFTGPNRRGRNFLSGMDETVQNGNTVTDLFRDAVTADYEELLADATAAGFVWVVASFYNGTELVLQPNGETRRRPIPRATALKTPIIGVTANANLDSQRRRLNGRGI